MIQLQFNVNQQTLTRTDTEYLVNHSENIVTAEFQFTGDLWENTDNPIYIIFKDSWNNTMKTTLKQNKCTVPYPALCGTYMKIAVYSGDLITTNYIIIPLNLSLNNGDEDSCNHTSDHNLFNNIFKELKTKYDDLILEDNLLSCYSNGELLKIINFDDLILNAYPTKEYVDNELNKKYDDLQYENGCLICLVNGEVRKKIPIVSIEEYYTRKEVDERFDEVNSRLDECIVNGEIKEDIDSFYLNFN